MSLVSSVIQFIVKQLHLNLRVRNLLAIFGDNRHKFSENKNHADVV